jgi:predicted PurR-regulated permease PerM
LEHPVAVGFALMAVFLLLRVLWAASAVLLLGLLSVLVATLLVYPVDFFSSWVPRAVAMLLTIFLVVGVLAGVVVLLVPVVGAQAGRFVAAIALAINRLLAWWGRLQSAGSVPQLPSAETLTPRLLNEAEALLGHAVPFALGVGSLLLTGFVLFVLAVCLAYSPRTYLEGLRRLVPRDDEPLLDELWRRLGVTLRHWTAGILGSMLTMGVLAGLGLWLAGIDGWFLLAILTFLGTFVPYVGALASAIPGLLIGLSQSPLHLLYAALVYAGVHLVEGYLVSPLIMRHTVRLRPATLLFWQLFTAAVFGLPGIMVATPLLAVTEVAVGYLYVERKLGKTDAGR